MPTFEVGLFDPEKYKDRIGEIPETKEFFALEPMMHRLIDLERKNAQTKEKLRQTVEHILNEGNTFTYIYAGEPTKLEVTGSTVMISSGFSFCLE